MLGHKKTVSAGRGAKPIWGCCGWCQDFYPLNFLQIASKWIIYSSISRKWPRVHTAWWRDGINIHQPRCQIRGQYSNGIWNHWMRFLHLKFAIHFSCHSVWSWSSSFIALRNPLFLYNFYNLNLDNKYFTWTTCREGARDWAGCCWVSPQGRRAAPRSCPAGCSRQTRFRTRNSASEINEK